MICRRLFLLAFFITCFPTLSIARLPVDPDFDSLATKFPNQHLIFEAFKDNHFEFSVDFQVKPTLYKGKKVIGIFTRLKGEKIQESNALYMSLDLEPLHIFQNTSNEYENKHTQWEVDNSTSLATSILYDRDSQAVQTGRFDFPSDGQPFQAMMYLFQIIKFDPQTPFTFHLLSPPHDFYEMLVRIETTENIGFNSQVIPCYKVEIRLRGLLGIFLPKSYFWVTISEPHIPLKYQDPKFIYYLKSRNIKSLNVRELLKFVTIESPSPEDRSEGVSALQRPAKLFGDQI